MKKTIPFLFITLGIIIGCKKTVEQNISLIVKTEVRGVILASAHCVGHISVNRGGMLKRMGFCWNTTGTPTIDDNSVMVSTFSDTSSLNYFDFQLEELTSGTTYFLRTYAENTDGLVYGNEVSFKTKKLDDIKIGEQLLGGTIFYVDTSGVHGLICAPTEIDYSDWGCSPHITTSFRVGSGLKNSLNIDRECPSSAASKCLRYNNIEGEWFLPTVDEWELIYNNLVVEQLWTPKNSVPYWTSTEDATYSAHTMFFNNSGEGRSASQRKIDNANVLPIKEF